MLVVYDIRGTIVRDISRLFDVNIIITVRGDLSFGDQRSAATDSRSSCCIKCYSGWQEWGERNNNVRVLTIETHTIII